MTLPMVRPRPRSSGGGSGGNNATSSSSSSGGSSAAETAIRYIPYIAGAIVLALIGSATIFKGYPLSELATASGTTSRRSGGGGGSGGGSTDRGTSRSTRTRLNGNDRGAGGSSPRSLTAVPTSSGAAAQAVPYRAGGNVVDLSGPDREKQATEGSSEGDGGAGAGAGAGGAGATVLNVFQPRRDDFHGSPAAQAREEADHRRMAALIEADAQSGGARVAIRHEAQNAQERRDFLVRNGPRCYERKEGEDVKKGGNAALSMHDALIKAGHSHLATEVWKYCALAVDGGAYLDPGTDVALLATFRDAFVHVPERTKENGGGGTSSGSGSDGRAFRNVAILGDSRVSFTRGTAHGSLIVLNGPGSPVARGMVELLVEADPKALAADPTVIPRALYDVIADDIGVGGGELLGPGDRGGWKLLSQRCHVEHQSDLLVGLSGWAGDVGGSEKADTVLSSAGAMAVAHRCPRQNGYCCDVADPTADSVVMVTRHPLLPFQLVPMGPSAHAKPYRWQKHGEKGRGQGEVGKNAETNAPFIATIREEVMEKPKPQDGKEPSLTPNFFDILLENDNCLPTDKACSLCLKNKAGGTCESCLHVCPCYCKSLCNTPVEEKFVSKQLTVTPPTYRKDSTRLVPRIVHQTWFEDVTKEKYPNMSRLIESWKRSGWEYRFYSDEAAAEYLSLHFPPEVREAYDSIIPGAFKADLFRYCALLIDGGVYADMDVLLETNLDAAVPGDVGFMTPVDEPGMSVGHRMCLWNGLIASAPGHPFLARVIENVVNNARNRFTSVDVDMTLCPNPEISVAHSFDILFTAGPCMLGKSINDLLHRHPQTSFESGTIDIWSSEGGEAKEVEPTDPRRSIPGRSIILKQDKWDMGAHRFTWEEENLVIAATDMPDYDDRDKLESNVHYSDTHVKFGVYGLDKLYIDRKIANEKILISVSTPTAAINGGSEA